MNDVHRALQAGILLRCVSSSCRFDSCTRHKYIPVVQVMEQRSPKPQAAGLSPAGNASCVPCEGAAQIAGHLAAKVPDAAALHRLRCPKTECTERCLF